LQPIYNLLLDQISDYDIASIDATKLQVLKEHNRAPQTTSKAWVITGGINQVVLFKYSVDSNKTIDELLLDFKGYLHGDADPCYQHLDQEMVYCNAHSRRHYEPIFKKAKGGIAEYAMNTYQKLYKIERKIKDLDTNTIYNIRQKEAKPIWDEFKAYLTENLPKIPPKSNLAEAVTYTLKYYEGLTKYLDDGRLYIDNNHTERIIRQFVLARNNFMFADTVKGANALCMHFSIIQTALINGIEPYDYYCKLFKELPNCKTVEDYEALLPWNINFKPNRLVINA
jgi:transposase